jgi:hypothetical protein
MQRSNQSNKLNVRLWPKVPIRRNDYRGSGVCQLAVIHQARFPT